MRATNNTHCVVLFKFESIEIIVKIEFAAFSPTIPVKHAHAQYVL
jgi:hypothetical protein